MTGQNGMDHLFEELEFERGVTAQRLTDLVSVMTGVEIQVVVLDEDEWASTAPFVLVNGDNARIPIRGSDPRWYRLHVVAHQLAHVLCGHTQCAFLPMTLERPQEPSATQMFACDLLRSQEVDAQALCRRLSTFVLAPGPGAAQSIAC